MLVLVKDLEQAPSQALLSLLFWSCLSPLICSAASSTRAESSSVVTRPFAAAVEEE